MTITTNQQTNNNIIFMVEELAVSGQNAKNFKKYLRSAIFHSCNIIYKNYMQIKMGSFFSLCEHQIAKSSTILLVPRITSALLKLW